MNLDLERKLRHLRLSGFVAAMPVRNQEAINNHLAYADQAAGGPDHRRLGRELSDRDMESLLCRAADYAELGTQPSSQRAAEVGTIPPLIESCEGSHRGAHECGISRGSA